LAKNVDRNAHKHNEDAPDADHGKHPVVENPNIWVIVNLYVAHLTLILPSLQGGVESSGDAHGQAGGRVRCELWQIAGQAGAVTRLTGGMTHRPAVGSTANHTRLTSTFFNPKAIRALAKNISISHHPLKLIAR
jgi:hypothetical protein